MTKMKNLLLAIAAIFAFSACNDKDDTKTNVTPASTSKLVGTWKQTKNGVSGIQKDGSVYGDTNNVVSRTAITYELKTDYTGSYVVEETYTTSLTWATTTNPDKLSIQMAGKTLEYYVAKLTDTELILEKRNSSANSSDIASSFFIKQ